MMKRRSERTERGKTVLQRLTALSLAVVMVLGMLVTAPVPAQAASWMDPYLQQAVAWGIMSGDAGGDLQPDRRITRAEFATMLNRAFGHTKAGPTAFKDVPAEAWYAEDISIAYHAGYLAGTSPTTAGPLEMVTREQAVAMLGRNMRMQPGSGAILSYTDNTQMENWSRGMIQQATDMGFVSGYEDGSFRPKAPITRGQAACIITQALGTLVNSTGEQSVGNVYGNLTINVPGVTLRDTVVTGNLYLAGGVGLEDVVLENVTVLGKIVVCGAGVSQKGKSSVILRNVVAQSLELDSMSGQLMSVRVEGLTKIGDTTVRTSAFVEDLTGDQLGLRLIKLDGTEGVKLELAGNIKEVVNLTPGSSLSLGQGVAGKVTIDEKAVDSTLNIDSSASIKDLALDTGVEISGSGGIGDLSVNANGSKLPMLPDNIVVRPGVQVEIGGTNMDSNLAAESSDDPRLLAGYPAVRNVAPKSADAVFSTNKGGTVYWALTALFDGSASEEELVDPSAYSAKILKSGTISVPASKTPVTAKLSGLTVDGSYYLSALLVDARGRRSPVKVTAFTTPDDSKPDFASGYPYAKVADDDGRQVIQAMVMPTKSCQLYYALLPKGSTAPTGADFKAAAITGNLGYGMVDVKKNTQHLVAQVNSSNLAEQTEYDLYLWLNDADNGKSSAVKRLTVKTLDRTPPVIQHLTVKDMTAKSISMTFSLDEPGTLYWAVVKRGSPFYNKGITDPEEHLAKIQVESGVGALKKGKANASKGASDVSFNITGLEGQTGYDLYYVAKDKAGNYNVYTKELTPPMEINTLDSEGPTVEQEFTHDGTDDPKNLTPYPDTSIRLVFSESVQGIRDVGGQQVYSDFLKLYKDLGAANGEEERRACERALAQALSAHISLYHKPVSGQPERVPERDESSAPGADWVIDYRKATVELETSGKMVITFPFDSDRDKSGLDLSSGATYYFELQGIADTSPAANRMAGSRGVTKLQEFTTIDAQMIFSRGSSTGTNEDGQTMVFDMNFRITPQTASSVEEDVKWDLLLWSKSRFSFDLYSRPVGGADVWQCVLQDAEFKPTVQDPEVGLSMTWEELGANPEFPALFQAQEREYGIVVKSVNSVIDRGNWSGTVSMDIVAVAGDHGSLTALANRSLTPDSYDEHQNGINKVKEIGVPPKYSISCSFRDTVPPTFLGGYPQFMPGDSGANMDIQLNRNNTTYYYVVTEVEKIPTKMTDGTWVTKDNWDKVLPASGAELPDLKQGNVTLPTSDDITNPPYSGPAYVMGSGRYRGGVQTLSIDGLKAETKYVAYFVLQGESQESISDVFAFRFQTEKVVRPVLRVSLSNPSATVSSVGMDPKEANVKYMMVVAGQEGSPLNDKMDDCWGPVDGLNLSPEEEKKYKAMTVIEAMEQSITRGSYSLGSVFDLCASLTKQDDVSAWFNSASSNDTSIMLTGDMQLNRGNKLSATVDCKKAMNPNNVNMEYWFLAMGQSPLGSGYAFSAGRYLFYPNSTPPQVVALSTETSTHIVNDKEAALNQKYSGTVTLTFSTDLYYKDIKENSTTYKQVVDKAFVATDKYVSSAGLITSYNASIKHQYKGDGFPTCRTLIIKFTNVGSGNQISLTQNIANSRGVTGQGPLALILRLEKDKDGYYIPQFEMVTPEWGKPAT